MQTMATGLLCRAGVAGGGGGMSERVLAYTVHNDGRLSLVHETAVEARRRAE